MRSKREKHNYELFKKLKMSMSLENLLGGNQLGYINTDKNIADTGLLRVTIIDPVTNSELKKAVYIQENQSTVEVIEMILNKANLNGTPASFKLSYKDPRNGTRDLI
jgi:hypothetical protein